MHGQISLYCSRIVETLATYRKLDTTICNTPAVFGFKNYISIFCTVTAAATYKQQILLEYGQIKVSSGFQGSGYSFSINIKTLKFKSDRSKLSVKGVSSLYVFTNLLRNMLIWSMLSAERDANNPKVSMSSRLIRTTFQFLCGLFYIFRQFAYLYFFVNILPTKNTCL